MVYLQANALIARELSGFTCTSSLTMNVSERVQVNPDNSRAMSALTFLLFKLNILQTSAKRLVGYLSSHIQRALME